MLLVVPLMLLPGILAQKKLAQLAQEGMRESSIRNAILVEAVQGIEDIKLLRAESRFQNQWNHMNEVSADIGMRQRKIVGTFNGMDSNATRLNLCNCGVGRLFCRDGR